MTRRLLLVDPVCDSRAPTMRALLTGAQKVLPEIFDEVEVWSLENQLQGSWVKWRQFPKISPFWPIQCAAFRSMAWRAFGRLDADYRAKTLIQCSGEHLPVADIRYVQFWNTAYRRIANAKPNEMSPDLKERLFRDMAIHYERKCVDEGATGAWWCVSRGIADAISPDAPANTLFEFLPNAYDPVRFNPDVRAKYRDHARVSYGIDAKEIVFGFSSFGHFVRKGLLQAVQVIQQLRLEGWPVRLLVLGGGDGVISDFKTTLRKKGLSADGIIFAGQVARMEEHLSGADALLFPSHFEAFSLAEIEAAALGLRLYLTPHPGSEMILREPVNGYFLPWDVDGMVSVLRSELENGRVGSPHAELGDALNPETYCDQLRVLYQNALARKASLNEFS